MSSPNELIRSIDSFYEEAASAFHNWGQDLQREGVYALHCGYYPEGEPIGHHEAVKLLTLKVIEFAQIKPGLKILDAGCGTGSVTFEIAAQFPDVEVHGINIAFHQLRNAQDFRNRERVANASFSLQDYLSTAFTDNSFDRAIFCESFTHAYDKGTLLEEVGRILERERVLVISDVFLKKKNLSNEEKTLLHQVEEGIFLPSFLEIDQFLNLLEGLGFREVEMIDATENILPSTKSMADHASLRLKQNPDASDVIIDGRYACMAVDVLMKEGVFGYFLIRTS
jgi:ubiquinone/menaquinone biosynthesis C-methylase UbiE